MFDIGKTTLVILGLLAFEAYGAVRAVTPVAYEKGSSQMARHLAKMKQVAEGGSKVVFIGDVITQKWEENGRVQWEKYYGAAPYRALNLGFPGDRTEHVLWRLTKGRELDGYEAKAIVLMIGGGNANVFPEEKEPPIDTINGIRMILKVIRAKQPRAKVVLMAIFPRGLDESDPRRARNRIVNKEICKYADGTDVFWLDFSDLYLTPEGRLPREIFTDGEIPSAYGYEIWASAVKPYVDYALSEGRIPSPPNRYSSFGLASRFRMDDVPESCYPMTRVMEPNSSRGLDWWTKRMCLKRNQIADSDGSFDLVMIGDSITHFWEYPDVPEVYSALTNRYKVLNLGYGGDNTANVIWRCKYGELDGYKAKNIQLMIGTNNGGEPKETAAGIRKILDLIAEKQPQATVYLTAIFPRGKDRKDSNRVRNEKVNDIISAFADGKRVRWLNFNDKLVDPSGDVINFTGGDRLHPNAAGYRVWLAALQRVLDRH